MRKRCGAIVGCAVLAISVAGTVPASAQYRDFIGEIESVGTDALVVDNQKGDTASFVPTAATVVEGQGRKDWSGLKKGDWVSVSWKMADRPRKAYAVKVLPPRKE